MGATELPTKQSLLSVYTKTTVSTCQRTVTLQKPQRPMAKTKLAVRQERQKMTLDLEAPSLVSD